jgi:hypothetical protein
MIYFTVSIPYLTNSYTLFLLSGLLPISYQFLLYIRPIVILPTICSFFLLLSCLTSFPLSYSLLLEHIAQNMLLQRNTMTDVSHDK